MKIFHGILFRMRNVVDKVIEKTKTHVLCSITFFQKPCRLWVNVEKYGRTTQVTGDNTIRRMCFACWITKTRIQTDAHNIECFLLFHDKSGYANSSKCYIMRALPVLLILIWEWNGRGLFQRSIAKLPGGAERLVMLNSWTPCWYLKLWPWNT